MESQRESRKAMRFPVEARVVYTWVDESGGPREGEGQTLNVSERGAFVSSKEHPPQGTAVRLKVFLPPVPIIPPTVTILMDTRVVRIENAELGQVRSGFAVDGHATNLAE